MAKSEFAWVTLVMINDEYIPGALAMGHSFRLTKTKYDIVCMVTPDVSEDGKKLLKIIFDSVVVVPYITSCCSSLPTLNQKEKYSNQINKSFTKQNCIGFENYKKVIFIDADMIVMSNIDDLFELNAPAGIFSNPQAEPFINKKRKRSQINSSNDTVKRKFYNPYFNGFGNGEKCDLDNIITHGSVVKRSMISIGLEGYEGNFSFVCFAATILLPTSKDLLKNIKEELSKFNEKNLFGFKNCYSGFDEQFIANFFHSSERKYNWHHIHQMYGFIPWKKQQKQSGDVPRIIHFFGKIPALPWKRKRDEYPDLEIFQMIVEHMLSANSEKKDLLSKVFDKDILEYDKAKICVYCKDEGNDKYNDHLVFDIKTGRFPCPLLDPDKVKLVSDSCKSRKQSESESPTTDKPKSED